ncbi:MAG: DUF2237 family protein [Bdellovibrionales bacterium]
MKKFDQKNILGSDLALCGTDPMTGFTRTGSCEYIPGDRGKHTVCAVVTEDFLEYTKKKGNDLSTPMPAWGFPGLKPGDRWCVCASRWNEARKDGFAPPIDPVATHAASLETIDIEDLRPYFIS